MQKSSATPPPAPDPVALANAQSASNINTATNQQKLNMVNTAGPDGTVNYAASDAPGGYTQTTTLSPGQQSLYDSKQQLSQNALGVANDQIIRVNGALQQGLQAPHYQTSFGNAGPIQGQIAPSGGIQSSIAGLGPLQSSYGSGGQIQGQVGDNNATGAVNQARDAAWGQAISRLAPAYGLQGQQLDAKLASQGIGINSAAYGNAHDIFGRQVNDALNQAAYGAVGAGNTEQNVLYNQALNSGNFANSAQAQGNSQNLNAAQLANQSALAQYQAGLQQGNFVNQAQAQQAGQNAQNAAFANQAQQQQYLQNQGTAQFANQAANQQFQSNAEAQNQPINQLTALAGLGQVQTPQGITYSPTAVAPTDTIGAAALAQQQLNSNYQAQQAQNNAMLGGLFKLGSSAITAASDRRLKRDVKRIGTRPDGLGAYLYRYLWDEAWHIGVMAQEALWVKPEAVVRMPNGFFAVDYAVLG